MKIVPLVLLLAATLTGVAETPPKSGVASWYGESHRGKLMANGQKFDPAKLTAASWFYPLGARVRVTLKDLDRSVVVTVTDRGPARSLVQDGRIIDLAQAAFAQLTNTRAGLVPVTVEPVE
jgi:rare lipoprotein A